MVLRYHEGHVDIPNFREYDKERFRVRLENDGRDAHLEVFRGGSMDLARAVRFVVERRRDER